MQRTMHTGSFDTILEMIVLSAYLLKISAPPHPGPNHRPTQAQCANVEQARYRHIFCISFRIREKNFSFCAGTLHKFHAGAKKGVWCRPRERKFRAEKYDARRFISEPNNFMSDLLGV